MFPLQKKKKMPRKTKRREEEEEKKKKKAEEQENSLKRAPVFMADIGRSLGKSGPAGSKEVWEVIYPAQYVPSFDLYGM